MSSPAKLVIQYLVDVGAAGDATPMPDGSVLGDWPAYNAISPDGHDNANVPDNMVTIYDTEGKSDGRDMAPGGEQVEHPGLSIFVRSLDYDEGYIQAKKLKTALARIARTQVTYKGYTYSIQAVHTRPIRYAGPAAGNRVRYLFSQDAFVSLNN